MLFKKPSRPFLFFWQKKEKSIAEKIEEAMPALIKVLPEIRKLMRQNIDPSALSDGTILGQMYDFFKDVMDDIGDDDWRAIENGQEKKADHRLLKKPQEVVAEIHLPPTLVSVQGLDEKISLLQDKSKLANQHYVREQIDGMIKRLENRRHYHKEAAFYESLLTTTDEKIDDLLAKYKLVIQPSDLFVPTLPAEAIDIMKKYTTVTQELTGEKPVFYIIAEEKDFEKKRKKLDPILLAQSPFGFTWHVLGAWDKEMVLLSEL